jgi:hypothetical protein
LAIPVSSICFEAKRRSKSRQPDAAAATASDNVVAATTIAETLTRIDVRNTFDTPEKTIRETMNLRQLKIIFDKTYNFIQSNRKIFGSTL